MARHGMWLRGAAILLIAGLSACVISVEPFITESGATFDARLVGHWTLDDGSDSAVVTRGAGNDYRISYTTGRDSMARTGRFDGRLGLLGNRTVLDVWPAPADGEIPEPYSDAMIPGHQLLGVDIHGDEVRLTLLDADTLRAALEAGTVRLASTYTKNQLVLRGSTAELQRSLADYLSRPGALGSEGKWQRTPRGGN
jgi:hypothetical protein